MDVSYGLKEFDQILEDLECLVVDFWFYMVNPWKPLKSFGEIRKEGRIRMGELEGR